MDTAKAALTDRAKRKRTVVRAATTKLINDVAAMADLTTVGELQTKFDLLVLKEDTFKERSIAKLSKGSITRPWKRRLHAAKAIRRGSA